MYQFDEKEFQKIINSPVIRLRLPTYKGVPGVQLSDDGKYRFSITNISSQEKDEAVCYVSGSESDDPFEDPQNQWILV